MHVKKKKKKTLFSILISLALFAVVRIATVEVMHLIPDYVARLQLDPSGLLGELSGSTPSDHQQNTAATSQPAENLPDAGLKDQRFQQGVLAYQAKQYSQAAQLFTTVLQSHTSPNAEFYLGMTHTHQQQYTAARLSFEQVLRLVPPQDSLAVKARNNLLYLDQQQQAL